MPLLDLDVPGVPTQCSALFSLYLSLFGSVLAALPRICLLNQTAHLTLTCYTEETVFWSPFMNRQNSWLHVFSQQMENISGLVFLLLSNLMNTFCLRWFVKKRLYVSSILWNMECVIKTCTRIIVTLSCGSGHAISTQTPDGPKCCKTAGDLHPCFFSFLLQTGFVLFMRQAGGCPEVEWLASEQKFASLVPAMPAQELKCLWERHWAP